MPLKLEFEVLVSFCFEILSLAALNLNDHDVFPPTMLILPAFCSSSGLARLNYAEDTSQVIRSCFMLAGRLRGGVASSTFNASLDLNRIRLRINRRCLKFVISKARFPPWVTRLGRKNS